MAASTVTPMPTPCLLNILGYKTETHSLRMHSCGASTSFAPHAANLSGAKAVDIARYLIAERSCRSTASAARTCGNGCSSGLKVSLGPPFEPALCGWAARIGYFHKFEAEVEPTNEEPATQEGTMDAEPAIQKPAAAIAQEVAEKIAMQEVIEETATAIAQDYAEESTAKEVSMDTKPRRREARLHRPRACQAAPSQEVSMFEGPAIKEVAGDIAQELAKT